MKYTNVLLIIISIILCLFNLTSCNEATNNESILSKKVARKTTEDIKVTLDIPEVVPLGDDVVWIVNLENTYSQGYTLTVDIMGEVISYRGDSKGKAGEISRIMYLKPSEANSVSLVISDSEYTPWLSETKLLQAHIRILDENKRELFFDMFNRTLLNEESVSISLVPSKNFQPQENINCSVSWTNPLSITLHNVIVSFHVTKNLEIDGKKLVKEKISNLAPSEEIQISKTISSLETGSGWISVQIMSDELKDIRGFKDITVIEPNSL